MKNLTRKSMVALGLMISLAATAHPADGVVKDDAKKVTMLRFDNISKGSLLTIKDFEGLVLYKESISESGDYSKGFDLTTLPDGTYFFELNTEFSIEFVPFTVTMNKVEFDKETKELIYKPVVSKKNNMVYVWKPAVDQVEMNFAIYYADTHDLVLSEDFDKMEKVSKAYDFSKAKKGDYVFVFDLNGVKVSQTVKI